MNIEITGQNAFYYKADYEAQTKADFASTVCLEEPAYHYETTSKVWRIVKEIFSVLLVLPFIYKVIHGLVGKVAIPASFIPQTYFSNINLYPSSGYKMKYKRFTIDVNGYKIDTLMVGTAETFANKRWMVGSMGNGMQHEHGAMSSSKNIASRLGCNTIYFNYPGVGASTGWPDRVAMRDSYRAVLRFLEERMGAKEIIGYGLSIGGGVQGDALNGYELKQDVDYVFIKDRTFSSLPDIAGDLIFRPAKWFLKLMGWNMGSVESSKALQCFEIIMQSANTDKCQRISSSDELVEDDGVITKNASLAKALLDDPNRPRNKYYLGIPGNHNAGLSDGTLDHLCALVDDILS